MTVRPSMIGGTAALRPRQVTHFATHHAQFSGRAAADLAHPRRQVDVIH